MDYIFLPCIDRIKKFDYLLKEHGLQPVMHFDFFKSQYIYPELHLVYKKPAMFFEYRVQWKNKDKLTQEGDVEIKWHLELENYSSSFDKSKNQNRALEIFKYHRLLKGILHGSSGKMFNTLQCTGEEPDLNPTTTNVHIFTFTSKVSDDIAFQISNETTEAVMGEELITKKVGIKEPISNSSEGGYVIE